MKLIQKFWTWYEKHYKFHLRLSVILFSWQIIHLIWMLIYIVTPRIFNTHPPILPKPASFVLAVVDYTEIPALISASFLYINDLRKGFKAKPFWLLVFLNTQWLHLFWITDEFVLNAFAPQAVVALPLWLAWVAILIDYLELPVMYDTLKKYFALDKTPKTPN